MLERKHNDTNRTWQHNNTARQQDDPAPRRSKLARGEVAALLLVASTTSILALQSLVGTNGNATTDQRSQQSPDGSID